MRRSNVFKNTAWRQSKSHGGRFLAALGILVLTACDKAPEAPPIGSTGDWQCQDDCVSERLADALEDGPASVLVDDVNGDSRPDVVFIYHGANFGQIYYQVTRRRFERGPRVTETGYHPNGLIRLPHANERLYLLNAEGQSQLRLFKADPQIGLKMIGSVPFSTPLFSAVFHWPGWGTGLAALPYVSSGGISSVYTSAVTLFKNFSPVSGQAEATIKVPIPASKEPGGGFTVADLDNDGVDEILLGTAINELLVIRFASESSPPHLGVLWSSGLSLHEGQLHRGVAAMDVDRDGDLDLLLPHELPPVHINVLMNDGAGHLEAVQPLPFPTKDDLGIVKILSGADSNGDQYLLAASVLEAVLYRFSSAHDGEVSRLTLPFSTATDRRVAAEALHDFDGDGWLDLMVLVPDKAGLFSRLDILFGPLWDYLAGRSTGGVVTLNLMGDNETERKAHED